MKSNKWFKPLVAWQHFWCPFSLTVFWPASFVHPKTARNTQRLTRIKICQNIEQKNTAAFGPNFFVRIALSFNDLKTKAELFRLLRMMWAVLSGTEENTWNLLFKLHTEKGNVKKVAEGRLQNRDHKCYSSMTYNL